MTNQLANERSLYLRQHAENPVDWRPWGDEALAEAAAKDLPLLISIGYSACHWCHVMAHESFEDLSIADKINTTTVPIKIDREERPDIDAIYMEAVQATTGGGGWPMTIFATPDGRPFFAGTYFPPHPRAAMAGLSEILDAVAQEWSVHRDELEAHADQLAEAIRNRTTLPQAPQAQSRSDSRDSINRIKEDLAGRFDHDWGGFSRAPKFPQPYLLEFLLRLSLESGHEDARTMALTTLDAIACGGIFDHLGGGVARYSTDRFWMVPHFEKMLYDQAGLLRVYSQAFAITRDDRYRYVATQIVDYDRSTLALPDGGLGSSQDADSEGEEGRYYIFRQEEIEEVLGAEAQQFIDFYGVTKSGNFEGRTILHRPNGSSWVPTPALDAARRRLLEYRSKRTAPTVDTSVITEWNAQYIDALFEAGRLLGEPTWNEQAARLLQLLLSEHRDPNGTLFRSSRKERVPAVAGDYAWLITACLQAFTAQGEGRYVRHASELAEHLIKEFYDPESGGFFTRSRSTSTLIADLKDYADGAVLSTNSCAIAALAKLSALTEDPNHERVVEHSLSFFQRIFDEHPMVCASLAWTAHDFFSGPYQLVIPGERTELTNVAYQRFLPHIQIVWGEDLPDGLMSGRSPKSAYLCVGRVCQRPTTDPSDLELQLAHLTSREDLS